MILLLNLDQFRAPSPPQIVEWLKERPKDSGLGIWTIRDEVSAADLYVYLYAKFGPPNGIQNLLRDDDSDNLIHWDWTLQHAKGLLIFLGMNVRTDVHLVGEWDFQKLEQDQLIRFIKADFAKYGKKMSQLRREILEDWEMFLNPYQNLRASINDMRKQLDELGIDHDRDRFEDPELPSGYKQLAATITRLGERYTRAFGLATSLRVLAPILAESFVNLLMFVLLKSDIKGNERLRDAAIRTQIDIKVQSLHINCDGFQEHVDWSAPACRAYNTVVNERNDNLHGNVVVSKLKTGEIYFHGKVPVFKKYSSLWGQTFATSLQACGYTELEKTLQAVDEFIAYVLTCLKPEVRQTIEYVMHRKELGRNLRTGRVGVLLPDHVVDMQMARFVER